MNTNHKLMMHACLLGCLLIASIAQAGDNLSLAQKAALFEHDMDARFVYDGQLPPKLKLPTSERSFPAYNMPDNAYMTGMYVGMLSMQFAATKDEAVRAKAAKGLESLDLLCNVSGVPGLLARAAMPVDMPWEDDGIWHISKDGKHRWRGDVSSDQMDGVFYGYALAFDLVANDSEKTVIAKNVAAMMRHLLDNERRIIGIDGKPTEWGSYYSEYVKRREPLNALILLQHLKVAHHVTNDPEFAAVYKKIALDEQYAATALKARRNGPAARMNYSDDILLALAYYPLLTLEKDPKLKAMYVDSYRRSWEGSGGNPGFKAQLNAYHNYMAADLIDDQSQLEAASESLRLFPLDMKLNRKTIARYQKDFDFKFDPAPVSSEPEQGQAVPLDRREKQWSVWVHNPYRTGDRAQDGALEYQALDYLMAYWYGRWKGHVTADR
jgi:hypothetical protein